MVLDDIAAPVRIVECVCECTSGARPTGSESAGPEPIGKKMTPVSALADGACRMDSCAASCTLGKAFSHNIAELVPHLPYCWKTKDLHR